MDGYPAGSLDHNLPYLVVAGLTSEPARELPLDPELREQGILLRSELPSLDTTGAETWREYIQSQDARDGPWRPPREGDKPYKFKIEITGRSFVLPPRRARLPDGTEPSETPPALHSPFSPLSPVSPLYPNGLINAQWIQKHQDLVPSVYLSVYTLTSDLTLATLHDNQLKTDINNLRHALSNSGYRTRLAVLLLGDGSGSPSLAEAVQERVENIRRGVGMDPKSFFYAPPRQSTNEFERTADSIISTVYATSIEYYRDLGRHVKKKRNRGFAPQPTVPPTSGTSRTLSVQDWNVRYDFKGAILAEFRQEMDGAARSYDQTYNEILSQDVMELIPNWSPRWNEARLLTDILSIRAIRCSLWNGQTTSAVRRWRTHRDRVADFIDRLGLGTDNYGWQAWEARWALVMAQLMEQSILPSLAPSMLPLFIQPEKIALGERLQPWEMLHHPGYWYQNAATHTARRRALALWMPEEDRKAPDALPASAAPGKAYKYDTYLCPQPHEEYPLEGDGTNHSQIIIDLLMTARSEFQVRKQHRLSAELSLECAKEMARLEAWDDVVALLRPLWEDMSFRVEGWIDIAADLGWVLRGAAAHVGLGNLVVMIDWELLHRQFTPRPGWHYDLSKSLDGVRPKSRPAILTGDDGISSFISASFVFKNEEGKAGETCQAQLSLTSAAMPESKPVVLKEARVSFVGSLKNITLDHGVSQGSESSTSKGNGEVTRSMIPLTETYGEEDAIDENESKGGSILRGTADLELAPGKICVYEMAIPLREPGEARAASVDLVFETADFDLTYTIGFREANVADVWFSPSLSKRRVPRLSSHSIQVQPKPPKIEVKHLNPSDQYYTNEPIDLLLEIVNAEEADASAKLELHVFGEQIPMLRAELEGKAEEAAEATREESKLTGLSIGRLATSQSVRVRLRLEPSELPTSYDVTARVAYHLVSDPATPILQIMALQINVVNPFEANYDIVPRLHPDPWPSLFDYEGAPDIDREEAPRHPRGLMQKWCLICHYASFATEDVQVLGMEAEVLACQPAARCVAVDKPELPAGGLTIPPKSMQEVKFDLMVQKLTLDDRGPASLDVAFVVKWRRANGEHSSSSSTTALNTTKMPVPRSIVLGTEPRVLASVRTADPTTGLMELDVTVENASSHFLTFGLTMEPSDEFAFSGAKQTTLHVLPVSRRGETYRLLPLVRGKFMRPNLVVRDKYFQKVLRIIPTEGMKIDKDGLLVWVPPAEGEGEERQDAGSKEEGAS